MRKRVVAAGAMYVTKTIVSIKPWLWAWPGPSPAASTKEVPVANVG